MAQNKISIWNIIYIYIYIHIYNFVLKFYSKYIYIYIYVCVCVCVCVCVVRVCVCSSVDSCKLIFVDFQRWKICLKFAYLGSSFSSTEKDINTQLAKPWTAIDNLSVIWKSNMTDKIKRILFQTAVVLILLNWYTTWTLTKRIGKKAWWQLHKIAVSNIEQVLEATLNKIAAVRPPTTHHENYPS